MCSGIRKYLVPTGFERGCFLLVIFCPPLLLVTSASADDTIEFLTGAKITGKTKKIRKDKKEFDFEVKIGEQILTRTYKYSKVHAVTINGKRFVLTPKRPNGGVSFSDGKRLRRTKAEVNQMINEAGTTPPDWFDSVSLNYPKTIDLSWPKYSGPWDPRKDVGQFIFTSINENPRRWKEGTKFLHHVLSVNKENSSIQQKVFERLGHCYYDLIGDWARAAFWWRKYRRNSTFRARGLADCYWKLGNKEMAVEQLSGIRSDRSRYGSIIKLWSDMGELDLALELAEATSQGGNSGGAYIGAGDSCRKHGRYPEAISYYRKVLSLPTTVRRVNGKEQVNFILKRNKQHAQTAIDNIQIFETLDLSRIPDGTYTGTSLAYISDLAVAVTIANGRIMSVRITEHHDKQYFTALTDTPIQIIKTQGLKGVDATSGATVTSQAIIDATARALASAEN